MRYNFTDILGQMNESTWHNNLSLVTLVTNCAVLIVTFVVGILANLFVSYAVYHQKSLQTSTNALLVNLALIDLLRCATDCPLLLAVVLTGHNAGHFWDFLCDVQMVSFSLICCVQLFTLACISAERYQAVANPFKTTERRKRVLTWIPLTWAVAIVVSGICNKFTKDSPVYVRCTGLNLDALKTYDTFGLYVLLPVWFACLTLIVSFYSRIFILVKAHNKKIFDKGILPAPATKVQETTVTEPVVPKEINDTQIMPKENGSAAGTRACDPKVQRTPDTNTLDTSGEALDQEKQVTFVAELIPNTPEPDLQCGAENVGDPIKAADNSDADKVPSPNGVQTASADQTTEVMGAVCMMPSFTNRDRGNKKKESKLAKRSGYIILTFLVFWMPLIGTVLLNAFVNRNQHPGMELIQDLEIFSVSIACMTSVTNPIIYAVVNPQFHTEFLSLKTRCSAFCAKYTH